MKNFKWTTDPEPRPKDVDERRISEDIDHYGIKPCCGDKMFIDLERIGPLRTRLKVLVKCSCGQELGDFDGVRWQLR